MLAYTFQGARVLYMKFNTVGVNPQPANVRRLMHTAYERYALGLTNFPSVRFPDPVESFPKKSQDIARTLFNAWAVIEGDIATFEKSVEQLINAGIGLGSDPSDGRGVVVTKIGRNMARIAVTVPGEKPSILLESMRLEQFWSSFEGKTLRLPDGEVVGFHGGEVYASCAPDMILPRSSNVHAVFIGDKDLPDLPARV
jgi:hypothetical protein